MAEFRIEIDVESLVRRAYRDLPWWQRAWVRLLGKERVIAKAVQGMSEET